MILVREYACTDAGEQAYRVEAYRVALQWAMVFRAQEGRERDAVVPGRAHI